MSRYVPTVLPLSRQQIEEKAQDVICRFYPELLRVPGSFPVLDFFDQIRDAYGLDPGVEQLPAGVEGITWPDGQVIVSEQTYRGAHTSDGRDRFTVVHECFHGMHHCRQLREKLIHLKAGDPVLYRRQYIPAYRDPEWQANQFAAAVLMPREMVWEVATGSRSSGWMREAVAATFGVSWTAAGIRLEQVGV